MTSELRAALQSSPLVRTLEAIAQGEAPLPDSSAKRHHLVPEFVVRRFSGERDGRKRVLQLDVRTGTPRWVDPATAASRSRFYRVTDADGTEHQRVEGFLALVENHAAPALRRLREEPGCLSTGDRSTLAFFFALLEGRTLGGLERVQRMAQDVTKVVFATHIGDAPSFARTYREAVGEATDEEIERQRKWMLKALAEDRIRASDPKAMALDLLLNAVGDSFQLVYQLDWWLLEAQGSSFVTSDRGLAMHDPTPVTPGPAMHG
jgi:hypothetical protein